MNYYYINTNTTAHKSGQGSPEKWIDCGYAFTSGDYEEYGVQGLGKLNPGDILFMYVNQVGVEAVGEVLKHWDKKTYEGDERKVDQENPEYRICVKWSRYNNPIKKADLETIFSKFGESQWWAWPTLIPIQPEIAEQLLKLAKNRAEGR